MVNMRIMGIRDKRFRQLARDSSCCKKRFAVEYYSRYDSHITNSCIFKNQIFKYNKTGKYLVEVYLLAYDPGLPKSKKFELFSMKEISIQKIIVVFKPNVFCFEISSFSSPGF